MSKALIKTLEPILERLDYEEKDVDVVAELTLSEMMLFFVEKHGEYAYLTAEGQELVDEVQKELTPDVEPLLTPLW